MSRQDKHKIAATLRVVAHKSKLLSHKSLMLLPAAATLGIFALVSVLFTSADVASNTYAANLGSQITTEVDGQYYVTLTAPDVNFSVSPSKNENAAKQRIDVSVETNVAGGAKLYLSMAGSSNSLHLNGNTAQSSPVIAAVPDGTDASSFPANTWGYSTDDQTYSAVPTTASDPALLANVDGETTGTTSGSVISASIPVYYAANVDTSIQPGSYSNRMTYSAVVDGGITAEATLTSIKVDGQDVNELQGGKANTILVTINLMAQPYGTPRVYYRTASPSGYAECGDVIVSSDESGHMTVQCTTTPAQAATGVTLYIAPKGSESDVFCADETYPAGSSQCEMGEWKWGEFTVSLPDIISPPRLMSEASTMQEVTPEFCASVTMESPGNTARLRDVRDNKYYWVAKLADGNCWMTQNLDLNLTNGQVLDPDTTDVTSDWNPGVTTYTTLNVNEFNVPNQSWDPGMAVWKGPYINGSCSPQYSIFDSSDVLGNDCTQYWLNVSSGWSPVEEYRNSGAIYNNDTKTYDAHYLAGNYYSFSAATASSYPAGGGTATNSICPKNWKLPTANTSDDGSFQNLFDKTSMSADAATKSPLFLVRAGYVGNYYLTSAGEGGYYRSSVWWYQHGSSWTSSAAYSMFLNASQLITTNAYDEEYGQSVRCVVITNK